MMRIFGLATCVAMAATSPLIAGTTDGKSTAGATTEEEPPEYKNWIEFGIGGLIINGDAAQFKQEHRMSGDVFGGIEDMHLEQTIGKATLSIDGRAIFDNDDYNVKVELNQPGIGYIRGGYTEFRSWYDGNGGFFPPNGGTFFPPPNQELSLDRGEAWVELGLRMPDWPEITVHYSHEFRNGDKDSTSWGDTNQTGGNNSLMGPTRKIAPAFRNIDETRDIFSFDALKTFGNTDVDLGMRYEHSSIDNRLQLERGAGQLPPAVPAPGAQRFITTRDQNDLDLFSGHMTTETRFSDSLWFTGAYSYTTLGSDIAGTRIIGADYNSTYGPYPTIQARDEGFLNLSGTSQVDNHVFNANLLWMPIKELSIITAFRYTHEEEDSDATHLTTNTTTTPPTIQLPPTPEAATTWQDFNNFSERLEARYTGIKNWLFYAEGEWTEEDGNVREHEVADGVSSGELNKDTSLLGQKYTVGANWYPMARLNLSGQYYYKAASYDNDIKSDLAGSNQRLLSQDWSTNDFNVRITFRPNMPSCLGTLSMVSRYDYRQTLVSGRWGIFPIGTELADEHTGLITSHVITETITWNPCARLYLQGTASYVLDQTDTPAANINLGALTSPTVVDFRNDYWTATAGVGYLLDDKTDLHVDYTFYRANDYFKNSGVSLPYGMGATEHTVGASISRQLTANVRILLRYGYYNYCDVLSGGHNNYEAHSVYSGLQFRF